MRTGEHRKSCKLLGNSYGEGVTNSGCKAASHGKKAHRNSNGDIPPQIYRQRHYYKIIQLLVLYQTNKASKVKKVFYGGKLEIF